MAFKELNHSSQAIYIHVPKVAGISIESAIFGEKVGHHTAQEFLDEDATSFSKYFSFVFVRCPYSRLASAFFFLKSGGRNKYDKSWAKKFLSDVDGFEEFVFRLEDNSYRGKILRGVHFRPQYRYVCNWQEDIIVDYIGRFERLEEDFLEVCSKLNITAVLGRKNVTESGVGGYSSLYSEKMYAIVHDVYRKDFSILGYER